MASIADKITQIRQAIFGKDVRENIASGIEAINSEVENTTEKQELLQTTFNGLIINAGNSNAEIAAGRTSQVTGKNFDTLGHRIDDIDLSLNDMTNKQGDLAQLNTSDKSSVVNAIKEVKIQANAKANQLDLDSEVANRINAVSNEKTERQAEIDVERKRINSFTALAQGSTTGDAELVDARIGADGVTYTNLGSATRGQFAQINSDLINSQVKRSIDFSTAISGQYINSANGIGSSASYSYIKDISLKKNEKVIFKATGFSTSIAMIAKQNSNGTYNTLVNSIDSTEREYTYTATEDMTIALSYLNTANRTAKILLIVTQYVDNKNAEMDIKKANCTDVTNDKYNVIKPVKNLIANGNFASISNWVGNGATLSASNNTLTVTGSGTSATVMAQHAVTVSQKANDQFFFCAKVRVTNANCTQLRVRTNGDYGSFIINNPIQNKWYNVYGIAKIPSNASTGSFYSITVRHVYADTATANGKVCEVQNVMMIDLNTDFGLGVNVPLYLMRKMAERNGYWEGTQNIIIKNSYDVLDSTVKTNNNLLLPFQVAAHSRPRKPLISFANDDGYEEDYTKLRGFSEKYNIPFTSAIYKNSTMLQGSMDYLKNELGWEFASHTYDHVKLADLVTELEIEYQMKTSKEYMLSLGIDCKTIVYPEGSNDERVRRIAKKYFKCAATTNTGINTGVVSSFYLKRVGLGSFQNTPTYDFYKSKVDEAIATNGWLIFMLHPAAPAHDDAQQAIIEQLIQYIIAQGVEVKTLSDGYEDFGNAIEIGDYIGGADGIAISRNGVRANI